MNKGHSRQSDIKSVSAFKRNRLCVLYKILSNVFIAIQLSRDYGNEERMAESTENARAIMYRVNRIVADTAR